MNIALLDQLPALAAAAEAAGEAAMQRKNDPLAYDLFRVMEAADALFLALTASVGELVT